MVFIFCPRLKSALEGTLNPLRTNGLLPHPKLPPNAALRFQVQVSPVIFFLYYYNVALVFAKRKKKRSVSAIIPLIIEEKK